MKVAVLSALFTASFAAAVPFLEPRLVQKRACGETADLVCYGKNGGTPQNINPDDIAWAAQYLRNIAQVNNGTAGAFWTMPPSNDCEEWQLPLAFGETVLSLAKHISPRINSSVLFEDMANTIDGGANPTPTSFANSLLGACGGDGGMVGVYVNASNPAYLTPQYISSGAMPGGIVIKIVHSPQ
ncbi:hypothetical protein F5B22DRAFT_648947 [Xylaria bambusicola]|uniref:uncharacterized protein n=1 Tax=Xylaria bambusicola TaxID=326684 RepID=UPI002007B283|nr:uncharacterized protein F5B22DRAFT_648947 [Xylaria bambusicola]KAI0509521.1 hypothetical protein F5B22DRAFT_648947 [Xylaria bambusicola]